MTQDISSKIESLLKQSPPNYAIISYLCALETLKKQNPEVANAITKELDDQRNSLKLIASENYCSLSVQLAMGNLLTDKYAEGFPGHRFYAGCENIDTVESRAASLACELFGAEHAYVQPHSGADANLVAFMAVLYKEVQEPQLQKWGKKNATELTAEEQEQLRQIVGKQTLMGLSLASGGHLTHGFMHNISSKLFRPVMYEVDPTTGLLDYNALRELAIKERPLILMAGYSAYSRRLNFAKMRAIADEVGAVLICDMAHFSGLVAGKVFQGEENPIPYADIVTSTTHKTLRGPRGGIVLCKKEYAPYVDKGCPYVLGGPLAHVMGAKAVAFHEALSPDFQNYSKKVVENARALAAALMEKGIEVVTGGTDNHLLLLDLRKLPINGRQAEQALREAGMTVNRNLIPGDPEPPWRTSGIRIGTPAVTTRGMGSKEMVEIADIMANLLKGLSPKLMAEGKASLSEYTLPEGLLETSKERISKLLSTFPLYPELDI
jgi:glycine hydroxymethyltransferase